MKQLEVGLGARTYPIRIGAGLLASLGTHIAPLARGPSLIVITDTNVEPHFRAQVESQLRPLGRAIRWHSVPAGEGSKSLAQFGALAEAILGQGIERGDLVLALGGGVVGDLAGYLAASLLRGLDFVQIPTSLLAQVDSSVGGKTGINAKAGKNLIGAFYQPRLVLIDTETLTSLPDREMRAGYAEVIKYGLIRDADFFTWLEREGGAVLARDPEALAHAIVTSCQIKAEVVAADEREQGERALLNLGHTFGHALEAEASYDGRLLHGEAVALGTLAAYRLALALGRASEDDLTRLNQHLLALGLPTQLSAFKVFTDAQALLGHMHKDKKVERGQIRFVLPEGIGKAGVSADVPHATLMPILDWLAKT